MKHWAVYRRTYHGAADELKRYHFKAAAQIRVAWEHAMGLPDRWMEPLTEPPKASRRTSDAA